MGNYVTISKNKEFDSLSVCFNIEEDKILEIGEKMNEINELAYMNGYNWDVFLNHYLKINNPDILEHIESDPEAGTYVAIFKLNSENEQRANKLAETIRALIENENTIYQFVEAEGDAIEWD